VAQSGPSIDPKHGSPKDGNPPIRFCYNTFAFGAGDGNRTRTVSLGMVTMSALAHDGRGQGYPCLTVAVRQGSFTDRSPARGSAVNVGVMGLVVSQHL